MPGPPGIDTLEIPRQPHELSISATISNANACQARWRTRPTARLGAQWLGLLFARTALIAPLGAQWLGLLFARTALIAPLGAQWLG
ncbi:hypothetical protein PJP10_09480, partial [Mycobacterium kansasii]